MPWKVASIVWPAIVAALLPLELAAVVKHLPHLLARLAALDAVGSDRSTADRSRPRQIDSFRSRYAPCIRRAARKC
jgi:hypothetical protein